eukprot:scaffold45576_cov67-Phaeocystis_antarctica.AAC.9
MPHARYLLAGALQDLAPTLTKQICRLLKPVAAAAAAAAAAVASGIHRHHHLLERLRGHGVQCAARAQRGSTRAAIRAAGRGHELCGRSGREIGGAARRQHEGEGERLVEWRAVGPKGQPRRLDVTQLRQQSLLRRTERRSLRRAAILVALSARIVLFCRGHGGEADSDGTQRQHEAVVWVRPEHEAVLQQQPLVRERCAAAIVDEHIATFRNGIHSVQRDGVRVVAAAFARGARGGSVAQLGVGACAALPRRPPPRPARRARGRPASRRSPPPTGAAIASARRRRVLRRCGAAARAASAERCASPPRAPRWGATPPAPPTRRLLRLRLPLRHLLRLLRLCLLRPAPGSSRASRAAPPGKWRRGTLPRAASLPTAPDRDARSTWREASLRAAPRAPSPRPRPRRCRRPRRHRQRRRSLLLAVAPQAV